MTSGLYQILETGEQVWCRRRIDGKSYHLSTGDSNSIEYSMGLIQRHIHACSAYEYLAQTGQLHFVHGLLSIYDLKVLL